MLHILEVYNDINEYIKDINGFKKFIVDLICPSLITRKRGKRKEKEG